MLGKGLESLIPPKDSQNPQGSQNQQANGAQNLSNARQTPLEPATPIGPATSSSIVLPAISEPSALPDKRIEPPPVAAGAKPITEHKDISHREPTRDEAIFQIEVEKIKPNPHQPRRDFEEESLKELASSIREFGVLQPILVSKIEKESETGSTVEYELIAGERRLIASKLAGLRTIPVIIKKLTPERGKLESAIIENIQRKDLNPIEEAKAFTRLQDEFKLTQREIAAKLGKSRESVANSVRLLNLPSDIQQALSENRISASQGRLLLSILDIGEQKKMFDEILKGGLSIRDIRSKIQKKKDEEVNEINFMHPEALALKERLEEFLGTKVDLRDEGNKGKITINFYSKEELQAIIDKLFKREPY